MRKTKKAIGYVCDVPVKGTEVVISKEDQRLRMLKYAHKENLDLICIYEDEEFTDEFIARPGVRKVLDCKERFEVVLVERVWCLSRSRKKLDPFLDELDKRGAELVASSYLWDCVSQQIRHRYAGNLSDKLREEVRERAAARNRQSAA